MGLCDVNNCYKEAAIKWTTGMGKELFVCEEHNVRAQVQMGISHDLLNPTRINPPLSILDDIAMHIVESEHGIFLRKFADTWLKADPDNRALMKDAWIILIIKYGLNVEYAKYVGVDPESLILFLG